MTASTHSSPTAPVLSIRCGPSGLELWPLENFGETVRASGDCRDMRGRSLVLGSGAAANRLAGRPLCRLEEEPMINYCSAAFLFATAVILALTPRLRLGARTINPIGAPSPERRRRRRLSAR